MDTTTQQGTLCTAGNNIAQIQNIIIFTNFSSTTSHPYTHIQNIYKCHESCSIVIVLISSHIFSSKTIIIIIFRKDFAMRMNFTHGQENKILSRNYMKPLVDATLCYSWFVVKDAFAISSMYEMKLFAVCYSLHNYMYMLLILWQGHHQHVFTLYSNMLCIVLQVYQRCQGMRFVWVWVFTLTFMLNHYNHVETLYMCVLYPMHIYIVQVHIGFIE